MALQAGDTIQGRYELLRPLGQGGMGLVFLARDNRLKREVALKALSLGDQARDPVFLQKLLTRFTSEAELTAQLAHPNIIAIYDFGVHPGPPQSPYMVMERLEGLDMEAWLQQHQAMLPSRLFPLFIGALRGIGAAHQAGVIHKDLKPSNLFLHRPNTSAEQLRVLDFGIAHSLHRERQTDTGAMLGTVSYMAPEYLASQVITPMLDVFQMGLILVELLTGDVVFESSSPVALAAKIMHGEVLIPDYLLESPLAEVIQRSVHVDMTQRYANADMFADALARVDPASIPTRPIGELRKLSVMPREHSMGVMQRYMEDSVEAPTLPLDATPVAPQPRTPEVQVLTEKRSPTEAASPREMPNTYKLALVALGVGLLLATGVLGAIVANSNTATAPTEEAAGQPPSPTPGSPAQVALVTPGDAPKDRVPAAERPDAGVPPANDGAETLPEEEPQPAAAEPGKAKKTPAAPPDRALKERDGSKAAPTTDAEAAVKPATEEKGPRLDLALRVQGECSQQKLEAALGTKRSKLLACMEKFGNAAPYSITLTWVLRAQNGPAVFPPGELPAKLHTCLVTQLEKMVSAQTAPCSAALKLTTHHNK